MIELPPCKIIGIFGPVASGKTHLIKQWLDGQNRILIFDATGEFVDEVGFVCMYRNVAMVRQITLESPYYFRIVYEPGRDLEWDFKWIMSCLWCIDSDKLLVVDEFHEICPVSYKSEDVNTLLRFARHDKMGFIGVSQRIADVHKLFTSSCRMVILFHTAEARDLDAIKDRYGQGVLEMVRNLRPLMHDDRTNTTQQIPQCVVIENRGQVVRVYDFQTGTFLNNGNPETSAEEQTDEPQPDSTEDADIEGINTQNRE